MSSSIEREFKPNDDLPREKVIELANHYIKYWQIEANHYSRMYWIMMERAEMYETEIKKISKQLESFNKIK